MKNKLLGSFTAVIAFLIVAPVHAQPKDETIRKIAADWKKRLERSGTIKYRVVGAKVLLKEYLTNEVDEEGHQYHKDVPLDMNFTTVLDFKGKRERTEYDVESLHCPKTIDRHVWTTTFDGHSFRGAGKSFSDGVQNVNSDKRDMGIMTENFQFAKFDWIMAPLFAGHGVILAPPRELITVQNMTDETRIEGIVFVHGQAVHDGRTCVVLRTHPTRGGIVQYFSEYWVDIPRDSALVRQFQYEGKTPASEWNISYAETSAGWLVDSWTTVAPNEWYGKFQVTEREVDYIPAQGEFTLPVRPGMVINRYSDQTEASHHFFRVDWFGRERPVRFENGAWVRILDWQDYVTYGGLIVLALSASAFVIRKVSQRRAGPRNGE